MQAFETRIYNKTEASKREDKKGLVPQCTATLNRNPLEIRLSIGEKQLPWVSSDVRLCPLQTS
jgi:hypothetical protein